MSVEPRMFGSTTNSSEAQEPSKKVEGNQVNAISTGMDSSKTSAILDPRMTQQDNTGVKGYYSVSAGVIRVSKTEVLKGVPTNKGFYYPSDVEAKFKKELDRLVKLGMAYVVEDAS